MITLTDLWLENYGNYKKAHLKLDKYPLTVIRGKNTDLGALANSNGVGKSTIFGAIPGIFYANPPMSVKRGEGVGLFNKDGSVRVRFTEGPHVHIIKQRAKGKSVAYELNTDGADLGIHKITKQQEHIAKIFPVSEEQYYSTGYLSPRDFHVLLRGKPDQRFDFFEGLYELGIYDKIYSVVSKEYNSMKASRQSLEFLKVEKSRIGEVRKIAPLEQKLSVLEANMQRVQQRIAKYREEQQHISAFISVAEGLDLTTALSEIKTKLTQLREARANNQIAYDKCLKQQHAYEQYIKIKTVVEETNKALADLPVVEETELEIESQIENYANQVAEIEAKLKSAEKEANTVIKLKRRIDALKLPPKLANKASQYTAKQLTAARTKARHQHKQNQEVLENLPDSSVGSVCPTCHQQVDQKKTNQLRAKIAQECEELEAKIENFDKIKEFLELTEELIAIQPKPVNIEKLKNNLAKYEKLWYSYKEKRSAVRARNKLQARLDDLGVYSKKISSPGSVIEELQVLMEHQAKEISKLEHLLVQRRRLLKMQTYETVTHAQELHDKYNKFIARYQPKLDRALSKFQSLSVSISNTKQSQEKVTELDGRIAKLVAATEDFDIYEALREAYGSKGLRILQINDLARVYCDRLNKYAHFIFPEAISFKTVVDKGQFDIIATRNGKSSDVRRLSGAESTAFILLSLIALLPYVPARKRLNLLVIDEVETGLGNIIKQKLFNEFIPQLNKIIPNIVLITPLSQKEMYIPNAHELLVTKSNGVSSIRKAE